MEEKRKVDELNKKTKGGESEAKQSSLSLAVWGTGGIAPRILNLDTRLR
jgi:hypothetical protein